jgi:hypothetical protein
MTTTDRQAFVVHLLAKPGADGVRALRALLKIAGRRLGLRAIRMEEAPMPSYRDKLEKMKQQGLYRTTDFEWGQEVTHVIDHLAQDVKMFDRRLDLLHFQDTSRQLQLNVTNGEILFELFGEPEKWPGREITLFLVPYGNDGKYSIRVKEANGPTPSLPATTTPPRDLDDEIPFN